MAVRSKTGTNQASRKLHGMATAKTLALGEEAKNLFGVKGDRGKFSVSEFFSNFSSGNRRFFGRV